MTKFLRFLKHVKECLVEVKEGHSSLTDWLPLLGCVAVVMAPWITRLFQPEVKQWHSILAVFSRNAWHISMGGLLLVGGLMFWRSFCRFDEKANDLEKFTEQKAKLTVRFHGPDPAKLLDPIVGAATCRIGVKNEHPTKMAKNVRVHLREVECSNWPNNQRPSALNFITAPQDYVLPLINVQIPGVPYDVYPGTERVFDLLFVDYGLIDKRVLVGFAPFVPPQVPIVSHPLSHVGFIPLMELEEEVGKTLKLSTFVTCDDTETLEQEVELRVPSLSEGPIPHFVRPGEK